MFAAKSWGFALGSRSMKLKFEKSSKSEMSEVVTNDLSEVVAKLAYVHTSIWLRTFPGKVVCHIGPLWPKSFDPSIVASSVSWLWHRCLKSISHQRNQATHSPPLCNCSTPFSSKNRWTSKIQLENLNTNSRNWYLRGTTCFLRSWVRCSCSQCVVFVRLR